MKNALWISVIHLFFMLAIVITYSAEGSVTTRPSASPFKSCHSVKEGMLNVHLVPHSHDDVGWLKTVDQYYYGSRQDIQKAGVQYILDSVTEELWANPNRRFVQVETYFLWRWFKEQKHEKQQQVRELVKSGRLEIAGGGITNNDEATTYYQCLVDEITWGFRRIQDMFGPEALPLAAWKIDAFGHSREMGSILAQMGISGVFFTRIDYQDKHKRLKEKTAELVWETSANLGPSSHLFSSIFYNHYSAPSGFCFDILCADEPINDDLESMDYNVEEKVDRFIAFAKDQAEHYITNNIIVPMGDDFHYQDAHVNFKNMDKLVWYVNERQRNGSVINVLYSTPSCYLKSVNDANITWPLKFDDFLPYGTDYHSYWTGFYTSRPNLKYFEKLGNNYLQVCKQLSVLASLESSYEGYLNYLRDAMGIMQHHDAITGTERQHVADNYALNLHKALMRCEKVVNSAIRKLMSKNNQETYGPLEVFQSCLLQNISECSISENSEIFIVTVYNPLSYTASHYVRLPVTGVAYSVRDPAGKKQPVQLVPILSSLKNMPGRKSRATKEIVFKAESIPPLGYRSFYVEKLPHRIRSKTEQDYYDTGFTIGNKNFQILFDKYTGLVEGVKRNETIFPLKHKFLYYKSAYGGNSFPQDRASGAYVFRPDEPFATPVTKTTIMGMNIYKGEIVEEVHQLFTDWMSQVVRIYKDEDYFELEWHAGPIPTDDGVGKEIISRFYTNFENEGAFYTDSNGREMIERRRNYRPTWDIQIREHISSNYYPVTTKIAMHNKKSKQYLAILTDRSQGGSSLRDGVLELMIHRRTLYDDGFGVGEALDEYQYEKGLIARGKHFVIFSVSNGTTDKLMEKELAQRRGMSPWIFLTKANGVSFEKWKKRHKMEYSGMKKSLPKNVKILTLEPWSNNSLLLRLEHLFEKDEHPILSRSTTVDLHDIFADLPLSKVTETLLGANEKKEGATLHWKTQEHGHEETGNKTMPQCSPFLVILAPMQIRTFIIQLATEL